MELKKNKIAVLCNYELLPTRVGGMDYFFWLLDQKCKEHNREVDWFFPNTSTHGKYPQLTIISTNYQSTDVFFADYCQTHTQTYSHVITHFVEICAPVFKPIKLTTQAKVIAIDHNPRPLGGYTFLKRVKKRIKGILYLKFIDCLVGVSAYTTKELRKDFGPKAADKTTVIYNGVVIETIRENKNRNNSKPSFLVASHLRQSKGVQDLIAAVALLPQTIREELVIDVYGDGPYRATLLERVEKKGLQNCFEFKGSVSNLHEVYANYDYLLQPTHMECFSLSILESLAANVPVLTTNVGGNEEAVFSGVNGYIYPVGDYQALKVLIESLWLGELQITGNTREAIVQRFTIEKMVENHYELIQS